MATERQKMAAAAGLTVALALLLWSRRAQAQDPDKAMLFGQVTDIDTGAGIQGISVNCNGYSANTNTAGDYAIVNIEPGSYSVLFTDPLGRYAPQEV